jgi:hypothetical protein
LGPLRAGRARRAVAGALLALLGAGCLGGPPAEEARPGDASAQQAQAEAGDSKSWETVPSVIRADGVDAFVLEVRPLSDTTAVTLAGLDIRLSGPADLSLHDDGLPPDRVAGDGVFSVGPFRYDPSNPIPFPAHYEYDPDSPAGLYVIEIGGLGMTDASGADAGFFIGPQVGLLAPSLPAAPRRALGDRIRVGDHLVEVRGATAESQRALHGLSSDLGGLLGLVYQELPDAFDFAVISATAHLEGATISGAGTAGLHVPVRVDYTGTGLSTFDNGAAYGSAARLLSVNLVDVLRRGWISNNWFHEVLHQWSAYLPPDLGFTDGGGHYLPVTSAASLLGGMTWVDLGDGTFRLDCEGDGRGAARAAAPLDLYMGGWIPAEEVPPLRAHSGGLFDYCGAVIPPEAVVRTATIDELRARLGDRQPGPGTALRDFRVAFVVEAYGRDLSEAEFTFFETLAAHATRALPADAPAPVLGSNWVPVTRYLGHGTTWRSDLVLPPSTPLRLQTRDVEGPGRRDRSIHPALRLVNEGSEAIPLEALTLRYWYTDETAPRRQVFHLEEARLEVSHRGGCHRELREREVRGAVTRVTPAPGADTLVELGFRAGAGVLPPGGVLRLAFTVDPRPASARYDELDDYSHNPSRTFVDWPSVAVYRDGGLVWGREPAAPGS